MICPFLSQAVAESDVTGVHFVDCEKENCQLWVTDLGTNLYGNCALHQIARAQQMNHDTPI